MRGEVVGVNAPRRRPAGTGNSVRWKTARTWLSCLADAADGHARMRSLMWTDDSQLQPVPDARIGGRFSRL
jgi:hypothetical protein